MDYISTKKEQNFLPISVNITDKRIVIVGGGKVGFHKASILAKFTDNVIVISPNFREEFKTCAFKKIKKNYQKEDLQETFLVYACTENETLNRKIKEDADELGILVSVCDNPSLCGFISPAIFKQESITISVSSNAKDVHKSIDIREQISNLVKKKQLLLK